MNNIKSFWRWFDLNKDKLSKINSMNEVEVDFILDEAINELHKYCRNLYLEIGSNEDKMELIISAEGDDLYFSHAKKIIKESPNIKGWKFTALKPPQGIDFILKYEDVTLDPSDIWFLPLENPQFPEKIGLRIGLPEKYDSEWLVAAVEKLIDTVIGEEMYSKFIKHLEITKAPTSPQEKGYIELYDLFNYINWKIPTH